MTFEMSKSLEVFKRRLKTMAIDLNANVEAAVKSVAIEVMDLSQTRVPLEESDLRNSAYIDDITYSNGRVSVDMGYASDYAIVQHETEEFNHPGKKSKNPSGGAQGRPFFLKSSIDEKEAAFHQAIKKALEASAFGKKLSVPTSEYPNKSGVG
jgi:hypothetical protein